MKSQKRRVFRVLALALTLVLLAGCGAAKPAPSTPPTAQGPTMEKEITVGYWGGPIGDAVKKAFVDTFEAKTGVKVNVIQELDNSRFTKLRTQKDHPPIDVAFFTDPVMPSVYAADVVAPYDPAKVPNAADLYPFLQDPSHKQITFAFGTWGIAYNKAKVGRDITSWADLLDPKFKGHESHPDITYNSSILSLVALSKLNGGDQNNLDPGFKNIEAVRKNSASFWTSPTQLIDGLKKGDIWISPYASGGTLALVKDNPDIAFVNPKEGAYLVAFHMVLVKNSAAPVAAQAFMNNVLDPANQKIFSTLQFYTPGNQKTQLDEPYKTLLAPEPDKIANIDWNQFDSQKQAVTDRWMKEVR